MVTGSNSNPQLQGNNFARNGVVYVNFNTRESIFASPHSSELNDASPEESQNFSILDVEKALEWIHDNIRGKNFRSQAGVTRRDRGLTQNQPSGETLTTSCLVVILQALCKSITTYGTTLIPGSKVPCR